MTWRQMILARRRGSQFRVLVPAPLGYKASGVGKLSGRPTQRCFYFRALRSGSRRKELHRCARLGLATSRTRKILAIVLE
jgi:hypothetical protein